MIDALVSELQMRYRYLGDEVIQTIYFGGGTPSVLTIDEISNLLKEVRKQFRVDPSAEITLEVNPEDLSIQVLEDWRSLGINRLSIGIQTFNQQRLKELNRSHDEVQSKLAIELTKSAGFDNFSCDLIYAIPPADTNIWQEDLKKLLEYEPPHISLYGLTIEENTVLGKWKKQRKFFEVTEDENAHQYEVAIQQLVAENYSHYEVSNFCLPGYESKHNTNYWLQAPYLGIGPGAHSYDGTNRSFTIKNNKKYIDEINNGSLPLEIDLLSPLQRVNEYILTRVRTIFGIDMEYINGQINFDFLEVHNLFLNQLISDELMIKEGSVFRLTSRGMFVADEIALKLFLDDQIIT